MGFREERKKSDGWSVPLARLALLLLIAHAFLVTASHFHTSANSVRTPPVHGPAASESVPSEDTPNAARHAQCPLCNLQRNFVAEVGDHLPVIAGPSQQPLLCVTFRSRPHVNESNPASPGRAPPPASKL